MRGFDNMKKAFSVFLLIATFVNLFVFSAFAESANNIGDNDEVNVVVNEDGSKVYDNGDGTFTIVSAITVTEVADTDTAVTSSTQSTSTAKKVCGNVSAINVDNTGAVRWRYTLYGYFAYIDGETSYCTDTHYTIEIDDNSWHLTSGNAYIQGNTCYGTGKMEFKVLFITTKTVLIDLHISCDVNGNLYA